MQDAEMFLSLAEIAGVFVGFGALISVRAGGASDAHEVSYIRWVMSMAIWVVVTALAPVIISGYDLAGHELWLVCSLLALILFFGVIVVNNRTPETREDIAAMSRATRMREQAANLVLVVPMIGVLILVVLGLFPGQEPALYLTAVGLGLFANALVLLYLVFSHGRPQPASGPAELPATGGSSA
jgi:archaellum biogenesis protein FlaJ (TadC family)